MKKDTVTIIGGGLSGLTAALYLSTVGADVMILEQGRSYADRNDENGEDILVGLGGAGTVSGGKLCLPPASGGIWRKTSRRMREFSDFYASMFSGLNALLTLKTSEDILRHSGLTRKSYRTEVVFKEEMSLFITELIHNAEQNGVTVRCGCQANGLRRVREGNDVLFRNEDGKPERRRSDYVLLATGRTSMPFLQKLFGPDPFHCPDLGIRLSMDTKQPAFSTTGEDVKLKLLRHDHLIRTFCVCCGGGSIKTATRGYIHYDGHFESQLTDITNLGILARSPRYAGPDAADQYLRAMQKYVDAEISLKDFTKYYPALAKNTVYEELFENLAAFISTLYQNGLIVQNPDEIPVMVPAVDNLNSPIYTNADFESLAQNVYVIGDAAGISRGFVQAMWAGQCAAERIGWQMRCKEIRR